MQLKTIYLQNFRSYTQAEFTFSPGINLIQGPNGLGKTNLLEAIHLLSLGRSFRTAALKDLIRQGQNGFFLEGRFDRNGIEQVIKMSFDGKTRALQIDGAPSPNFSSVLGLLPSVLFAPADHDIIAGQPAERRRLINLHIAQTDPLYIHHLMRYGRALKQRNCLLRNAIPDQLPIWEAEMAPSAEYICTKRAQAIADLSKRLPDHCDLTYSPSIPTEFATHWQINRERDIARATTSAGPHRDDLSITIYDNDARLFASEGQKRSYLAALRLAQWEELKERSQGTPLMSIDDFGVHLDASHAHKLGLDLQTLGQVFLTTALDHIDIPSSHRIPLDEQI